MHAEPLRTLADALAGSHVRNSYREYMTGDPNPVSFMHQARWYYGVYRPARSRGEKYAWLFWEGARFMGGRLVGYGGLSLEEDRWWLTAGLVPVARGRGLGEQMFAFLTYVALGLRGEAAWLKVHTWNTVARKLYEKLGYEYVIGDVREAVLTMANKSTPLVLHERIAASSAGFVPLERKDGK